MMRPLRIISADDIRLVIPNFKMSWLNEFPADTDALLKNLGMDVMSGMEVQEGMLHRSQLNGIVTCDRIVGCERLDKNWVISGNASEEAKDFSFDISMAQELKKMKKGSKDNSTVKNEDY